MSYVPSFYQIAMDGHVWTLTGVHEQAEPFAGTGTVSCCSVILSLMLAERACNAARNMLTRNSLCALAVRAT